MAPICEVLISGCFNVCHADHIRLLEFGSRFGRVTVGLNTDPYLQRKYGHLAVSLVDRAAVLRAIKYVYDVVSFSEDDPSNLIRKLKPNMYIRGSDYQGVVLPEEAACVESGTKIVIHCSERKYSAGELSQTLHPSAFIPLDFLY